MMNLRAAPGRVWLTAGALLVVFFLQVLLVSRAKSPGWDEPGHIAAGLANLETGNFLVNPQHPPLLKEFSGLSLMLSGAHLPEGAPTREFLNGNPAYQWMVGSKILVTGDLERNLLRARLPLMLVAVMLGALIFVWGRQLVGTAAALGGLFLFALDPTVIAHSGMVTMDVGCSAFMVLMLFAVWNYAQRPGALRLVLCGLAMGAALAAKFTAIFLLPVVGVLLLAAVRLTPRGPAGPDAKVVTAPDDLCPCGSGRKYKNCHGKAGQGKTASITAARAAFDYVPYGRAAGAFGLMLAIALVMIEVVYGFHGGIGRYIAGMRLVNGDHDPNYLAYMGGQLRYRFPSYFAMAYLLKEPVAALVLAGVGFFQLLRARDIGILAKLFLLLPPLVLFAIHSMFADDLGIRYIIGMLPFTFLVGGLGLAWLVRGGSVVKRCAAGVLCAWLVAAAAGIYPDQLSYFNEMACLDEPGKIGLDGGSRCGPQWLDDSNVDWGQGLKQLSAWVEANAAGRPVRLAYFGSFPPEVYGLPPQSDSLSPMDLMRVPAPGLYAVSTHLYAHTNGLIDKFRQGSVWMRITPPRAIVGHAYYIYDIR
jgi:dolichyl-phosphate-mannose-protein mannosyltransferase/SEC-C motif-containing protein